MQKPHSKDLRRGRYSQPDRIYLITVVTAYRRPAFGRFDSARVCIDVLRLLQDMEIAETLAFVVMPDHVHWLCRLQQKHSISRAVQMLKAEVARRIRRGLPHSERALWQRGFHDRALRKDEDLAAVARYIVANPVRARLTGRVGEYPHWDCVWL